MKTLSSNVKPSGVLIGSVIPRLTWKDIRCWKVVKPTLPIDCDNPRYSPSIMQLHSKCRGMYILGKVAKAKILGSSKLLDVIRDIVKNHEVHTGFIHCYARYEDIDLAETRNAGHVILECIIPKGTLYYISSTRKFWPGSIPLTLCARKIKLIKIYENNR